MIAKEDIFKLNEKDLYDILRDNYPDILQSMQKENYEIECPRYFLFKGIIHDDNVVGFMTFELLQYYSNDIALNECYILPEYRSKGLLGRELIELIESPNVSLFITRPSKNIVKVLLMNNLAVLTEDNIAISFIPFMVEGKDVFKSKKIRKYVKSVLFNSRLIHFSLIYDFNLGSVVFKQAPYYYPFEDDEVLISKPRLIDGNKDADKIRPQYLKNLASMVYSNKNLIKILKNEVYSRIRDDLSVKNLIGTENKLNPEFIDLLDENNLTKTDGLKIREEIIDSLNSGDIKHKGIQARANYLMGNKLRPKADNIDLKCPYCENHVAFYLKTCPVCGHDLTSENSFQTVKNIIIEYSEDVSRINAMGDVIVDGCNMYDQLIQWAYQKDYDLDEVYDAQAEYVCFDILQGLGEPEKYSLSLGFDSSNKIREGSGAVYAINHDYIEDLTVERYRYDLVNNYSISDLKSELSSHDIPYECDDREHMIEQIFNDEYFDRFLDEHFVLTRKGEEFIKNPILKYYHEYLSRQYYYYEFKKLYLEHKDDLTLDEIAELLDKEV